MNIIGLDALVFGVDDLAACRQYLIDYGLRDAGGDRFEALDGTAVVIRAKNDPSLPPGLGTASMLRETVYGVADAATLQAIEAIEQADFLIVGAPVFRASLPGLLKHLFDLVDYQSLKGVPVVLAATGGSERHALMIDHQLRPLFAFFQAHTLPYGLYASVESFDDQRLADPAQFERIERVLDTVGAFFHIPVARAA